MYLHNNSKQKGAVAVNAFLCKCSPKACQTNRMKTKSHLYSLYSSNSFFVTHYDVTYIFLSNKSFAKCCASSEMNSNKVPSCL